jgi:hypothetical protein
VPAEQLYVATSFGRVYASGHVGVAHRGPLLHSFSPCTGTGRKSTGTLKPSITEMSKKSWVPPVENSASVLGGLPDVLQASAPPQSPVWHEPLPLLLNEQPVRAQMRPLDVPAGTSSVHTWPVLSSLPPAPTPTGKTAGHRV